MEVELEERVEMNPSEQLESESRDIDMNNKLFLGDQIKINATVSESKLQNNVYEIVYIDLTTVNLNDKKTQQVIKLRIHDGEFADKIEDEDILEIQVLQRKPTHKFVEQHDLKINMLISVELALTSEQIREQLKDVTGITEEEEEKEKEENESLVIRCKIIDVDVNQDMIEVKILLDDKLESSSSFSPEVKEQLSKDSIFINFGCRGLPFWIKRIKVIEYKPPPSTPSSPNVVEEQATAIEDEGEEGDVGIDLDLSEALDEGNHIFANIMYEVPSSQKIVSEVKQYNDLLENIIASVPKHKRTEDELNRIHRNIERFFQLRKEYSIFDKNGVPKMPAHLTDADKPAVSHIQKLDTPLYWVLPVVENIKKLYVTSDDAQEDDTVNGIYNFKQQIMEEKGIYPDRNAPYNPNIMNDLNSYLTPFENPKKNPDRTYIMQNTPVHSNILTLSTNNDTIVSRSKLNRSKLNPSKLNDENAVSVPYYIDRMYNTGLTKLEFEDVKSNNVKRVDSTPDDSAFVTSFMTLDKPAVHLSQLLLPDTFLADQAALNSAFLKTWHSIISNIKLRDDIPSEMIRVFGNGGSGTGEQQYTSEYKGALKDATLFLLDSANGGSTNTIIKDAIIKEFITSFVPTNKDAFHMLEESTSTSNPKSKIKLKTNTNVYHYLSLYKVIYSLQPFLIYLNHVNSQQYEVMRAFIHKNIDNYIKKLEVSKSKFKKLVNKNDISGFESLEMFYNVFSNDNSKTSSSAKKAMKESLQNKIVLADDTAVTFDEIFKLYKFNELKRQDDIFLSASEILKIIIETDYARLFMDALAVENSDLTSSEIDSIIRREQADIQEQLSKNTSSSDAKTCKKREITLSKVYSSNAALEIDNNKEDVLFDARYDPSGRRFVKDGDYAVLKRESEETEEGQENEEGGYSYEYFVRRDNKWVKDDDPELQNVQLDDPSYFCNIPSQTKPNPLCFSINQKCLDKSVAETSILQNLTSRIVSEFDQKSEAKRKNIDETFLFDLKNIKLLDKLKVYDILKYNKLKYVLGQENKKRVETVVTSPYQDTVNCILGLEDVGLKYQCILDMVNSELFVRNAAAGDDAHWFYCKTTGIRLLPTFFYDLAQSYNPADPKSLKYMSTLSRIEKSNGKREGDQIVDKFSGYAISRIALVSESEWMGSAEEEGETNESMLHVMRDEQLMASDITSVNAGEIIEINIQNQGIEQTGTAAAILKEDKEEAEAEAEEEAEGGELEKEEQEEKEYDFEVAREEYETMIGIINHYEHSLSIVLKPREKRFIIENIQFLVPAKKTKEQYEADKKTSADYETYEKTYNQYLIFYCMALIIIVVQTSIPQIKTKSTFPNCVKSFEGYPYSADETNLPFIIYMACITQKVKSEYAPWNSVKKINQDKMRETLFNLIKTKIINLPVVQARFEAKRENDALKKQREIMKVNARHRISDALFLFRPLLVNPSVVLTSTPLPVTKTYCDDLKRNLKNGNSLQTENILVIQSKVIHFSLLVQKLIQDAVTAQTGDKNKLLSRNYIQNACCNEKDDSETVLEYMIKKEPNIKNYCDMVECNSDILHDVYSLSEAATMLDPKDTRTMQMLQASHGVIHYATMSHETSSNFDEYTIYNAFMTYCNYDKHKGIKAVTSAALEEASASASAKKKKLIKSKEKAEKAEKARQSETESKAAIEEEEEQQEQQQQQEVQQIESSSLREINEIALSQEIQKICKFRNTYGENRDIFNILKSAKNMTHENKLKLITQIKNEFNLDYTIKDLQHLLQLVHRQTMKPMYEARVGTYNEHLNRILTKTLSPSVAASVAASLQVLDKDVLVALKAFNENPTTERSRNLQRRVEQTSKALTEQITAFLNMKNKGTANAVFRTLSDIAQGVVTKGGIMLFHKTENTLLNGENNTLEVSVEFVKNAIKNITQVYPNMILNQVSEIESLPPYITGQLSSGDASSIIAFSNERVTKTLGNFYKIGNKKPVSNILKNVQSTTLLLNEIIENTPIYHGDNKHITVLLYEYYFLASIYSYLHFSNVVKQFREKKADQAPKQKNPIDVQKEVSRILTTYFELILDDKKIMNRNIETIRENYLRSLDDERDDIVQNVDQMSEDQKQIYLNHKKYKMGSQSIGKNAGLRIYNPDFETEELARIERINNRKKERGIISTMLSGDPDPEALAREDAVADEGDAPDYDPDEENEMNEDDAHEEYANSADLYPDSYVDVEGVNES
jgi:hypothetical protein